jgi:hypothetical protein
LAEILNDFSMMLQLLSLLLPLSLPPPLLPSADGLLLSLPLQPQPPDS